MVKIPKILILCYSLALFQFGFGFGTVLSEFPPNVQENIKELSIIVSLIIILTNTVSLYKTNKKTKEEQAKRIFSNDFNNIQGVGDWRLRKF